MARFKTTPSPAALEEVRGLAGPSAVVLRAERLAGGQHAETWRVDTEDPRTSVVVREFPRGDSAPLRERLALRALDGLGGLAPAALGGDLDGSRTGHPTSLIGWIDGRPAVVPAEPREWARELGRALAAVHAVPGERLTGLPSVFDEGGGSLDLLAGPLAAEVRSRWAEIAASAAALSHGDYWSGNVVWHGGRLVGVVDWSGAARGPRGFDLGWCRLDLVLLFGERVADDFLRAYEGEAGGAAGAPRLWDLWAAARSHDAVGSWAPNYLPLGRADLDEAELRRRHARWTERLR